MKSLNSREVTNVISGFPYLWRSDAIKRIFDIKLRPFLEWRWLELQYVFFYLKMKIVIYVITANKKW